jgi:hypothetical protein
METKENLSNHESRLSRKIEPLALYVSKHKREEMKSKEDKDALSLLRVPFLVSQNVYASIFVTLKAHV